MDPGSARKHKERAQEVMETERPVASNRRLLIMYLAVVPTYFICRYLKKLADEGYLSTSFSRAFYSEWFWLGDYIGSWENVEKADDPVRGVYYPHVSDFITCTTWAVLITAVRDSWERFVALPVARAYRLPHFRRLPPPSPPLEAAYKQHGWRGIQTRFSEVAKQVGMPVDEVIAWCKDRRALDKPTLQDRFTESTWRLFVYMTTFSVAVYSSVEDSQVYTDPASTVLNLYELPIRPGLYYLIQVQMGLYYSMMYTQLFRDIQRSDHYLMLGHHITAITICHLVYATHCPVLVLFVLVTHDVTDWVMEICKCLNYLDHQVAARFAFAAFAIVWTISRQVLFAYFNLAYLKVYVELYGWGRIFPGQAVLLLFLGVLYCMDSYWWYLILHIVRNFYVDGVQRDMRSDSEDESGEVDDVPTKTRPNGVASGKEVLVGEQVTELVESPRKRIGTQRTG